MHHDSIDGSLIELTDELPQIQGVRFSLEHTSLTGNYGDELSLFRAKRCWTQILEDNFLLEPHYDYSFTHQSRLDEQSFSLTCNFLTACGRYAFWRLTNNQAPEAQYLIETAHIPNAELRQIEVSHAPDLYYQAEKEEALGLPYAEEDDNPDNFGWLGRLTTVVREILKRQPRS